MWAYASSSLSLEVSKTFIIHSTTSPASVIAQRRHTQSTQQHQRCSCPGGPQACAAAAACPGRRPWHLSDQDGVVWPVSAPSLSSSPTRRLLPPKSSSKRQSSQRQTVLQLLKQWWRRPSRQPRSRMPWLICRSCGPSSMRYACVAAWPGHVGGGLHADELPACLWLSDHRVFGLLGLARVAAGPDLYCLLPSLPFAFAACRLRLITPRRHTAPSLRSRWTSSSRPQPQQPAQHALTWPCRWVCRALTLSRRRPAQVDCASHYNLLVHLHADLFRAGQPAAACICLLLGCNFVSAWVGVSCTSSNCCAAQQPLLLPAPTCTSRVGRMSAHVSMPCRPWRSRAWV